MIKFFHKIRYQLLGEGKTGKYLNYAIGEIVLVMVGILLALQVNNLNEERKLKKSEISILESLIKDLKIAEEKSIEQIQLEEKFIRT